MAKTAETKPKLRRVTKPKEPAVVVDVDAPIVAPGSNESVTVAVDAGTCGRLEAMNDYAARVRANQGVDMKPEESRARIIAALEGQGYSDFDGLIIPA